MHALVVNLNHVALPPPANWLPPQQGHLKLNFWWLRPCHRAHQPLEASSATTMVTLSLLMQANNNPPEPLMLSFMHFFSASNLIRHTFTPHLAKVTVFSSLIHYSRKGHCLGLWWAYGTDTATPQKLPGLGSTPMLSHSKWNCWRPWMIALPTVTIFMHSLPLTDSAVCREDVQGGSATT